MCNCIVRSICIYILDIIGVVILLEIKNAFTRSVFTKILAAKLTTRYIFLEEKYLVVGGVVIRAEENRDIFKHLLIHGTSNTYENQF